MRSRRFSLAKESDYSAMLLSPTTLPPAPLSRSSTLLFPATDFIRFMSPTTPAAQPLRSSCSGSPPSVGAMRSRVLAVQIPLAARQTRGVSPTADIRHKQSVRYWPLTSFTAPQKCGHYRIRSGHQLGKTGGIVARDPLGTWPACKHRRIASTGKADVEFPSGIAAKDRMVSGLGESGITLLARSDQRKHLTRRSDIPPWLPFEYNPVWDPASCAASARPYRQRCCRHKLVARCAR
jgi:hypothetical protein